MINEKQLSLEEVIELARKIDNWYLHGDNYHGSDRGRLGDPIISIRVREVTRFLRKPTYNAWVNCGYSILGDYTDLRFKEIYDRAKISYENEIPKDRERGLSRVKIILQG